MNFASCIYLIFLSAANIFGACYLFPNESTPTWAKVIFAIYMLFTIPSYSFSSNSKTTTKKNEDVDPWDTKDIV